MNEFIVWDDTRKKFVDLREVYYDSFGNIEEIVLSCENEPTTSVLTFHDDIGIKDINNKKIYADCSIVEFKHINTYGCSSTRQGYFTFDNDLCCYIIKCINEDLILIYACSVFSAITDIKIIDTIQENKLGLIK